VVHGEALRLRTPFGEQLFNANKPSYGPRAIAPALGNDPVGTCDPLGLPRILFYRTPMEFIQIPGRVFQFFERTRVWREIWTDGRQLPKDAEPAYMGHSVGRWEGDTLIVDSIGFDARTWLDHFGNPHSDQMRLEERWRRVNNNTLEVTVKLDDPKVYTKPWVSEKRRFTLQRQAEFEESFCIPSEELEFNRRIRNPAAGLPK
jgi:hypothetical protein